MIKKLAKKPTNKTTEAMYMAIAKYIKETGGSAVVVGGVSIMKKPGEFRKYNYLIIVDITGKCPIKI